MLIGFIGCPSSGKTTTAAIVYSRLKTDNAIAEFISEQARYYIAEKRNNLNLLPQNNLLLNQEDQINIIQKQHSLELSFANACGDKVIIISDGCVFNSLLYMDSSTLQNNKVKSIINDSQKLYTKLYYCTPIKYNNLLDPNRVHSQNEAKEIDKKIPEIISKFVPKETKIKKLTGSPERRASDVISDLYTEFFSDHQN